MNWENLMRLFLWLIAYAGCIAAGLTVAFLCLMTYRLYQEGFFNNKPKDKAE